MAAFNYAKIRDSVVKPNIEQFGKTAVLTQPGPTTGPDYDPVPGTPVETPVRVLELGPPGKDNAIATPGTLVRFDDRQFLMSTDGEPAPDLNGTLTVGSETLQVVSLTPNQPGSVIMFWRVRCAK